MDEYLGVIKVFGFGFPPRGWALCDGSLFTINSNAALFSLLGTTYGGNGTTTFAIPDLRGRVAVGQGQGPSLQNYQIGSTGGVENVTLLSTQMPAHTHSFALNASSQSGTLSDPTGAIPAGTGGLDPEYTKDSATGTMASQTTASAGGNQSHENRQPFLTVNYSICLSGIYPSRN